MRSRLSRVSACAVMAMALMGCGSADPHDPTAATSNGPAGAVDWAAAGGSGYLYLLVNTDGAKHYEIERVDLGSGDSQLITDVPGPFGVSMFSVSSAGMVVSEAPENLSLVARMGPEGELTPLAPKDAAAAVINSAGAVAFYVRGVDHVAIAIRPSTRTRATHAVPIGESDTAVWESNASLLVMTPRPGTTHWRAIGLDGRVSKTGRLPGKHWPIGASMNPGAPLLLGSPKSQAALLWWPATGKSRAIAQGWAPSCASPDGKQVMVTRGREIGVISVARPDRVKTIGRAATVVLECGWSTKRFGAGTSASAASDQS